MLSPNCCRAENTYLQPFATKVKKGLSRLGLGHFRSLPFNLGKRLYLLGYTDKIYPRLSLKASYSSGVTLMGI